MRRHIIGILALLLLTFGLWQIFFSTDSSSALSFIGNSGIRIGLVLAALWLAFPEVKRVAKFIESMPSWFFYLSLAALFAAGVIKHPAAILLIVPVLFLMWMLKPPQAATSKRQA
jgi:Na+/phosphate symporter